MCRYICFIHVMLDSWSRWEDLPCNEHSHNESGCIIMGCREKGHNVQHLFSWVKVGMYRIGHLWEGNDGEHSHCSEHDGGNQHDHSWPNVGAEEGDGSQPATGEGGGNNKSQHHRHKIMTKHMIEKDILFLINLVKFTQSKLIISFWVNNPLKVLTTLPNLECQQSG